MIDPAPHASLPSCCMQPLPCPPLKQRRPRCRCYKRWASAKYSQISTPESIVSGSKYMFRCSGIKAGNQKTCSLISGPLAMTFCIILASPLAPLSLPAQVFLRGKPSLESAGFLLSVWLESKNESATFASGKTVPSSSIFLAFFIFVTSPRHRGAIMSRTADWTDRSTELGRARLRHPAGRGVN